MSHFQHNSGLFFETIRLIDGSLQHVNYHNQRFNKTREENFGIRELTQLEDYIKVPEKFQQGLYKCRVTYGAKIEKVEFDHYILADIRTFKLIRVENIEYSYKYTDRSSLHDLFSLKEDCDEIIIIKDGYVTDTSIANIAFYSGSKWITPASPLLPGTHRARLIHEKVLMEQQILEEELLSFSKIWMFNAMMSEIMPVLKTTFKK